MALGLVHIVAASEWSDKYGRQVSLLSAHVALLKAAHKRDIPALYGSSNFTFPSQLHTKFNTNWTNLHLTESVKDFFIFHTLAYYSLYSFKY